MSIYIICNISINIHRILPAINRMVKEINRLNQEYIINILLLLLIVLN